MKLQLVGLAAMAGVALMGCDSAEPAATPAAPAAAAPTAQAAIGLRGEGLQVGGAMLAFGAPRAEVEAAVKAALGADPEVGENGDCPTGATTNLSWGDALQIITRDDAFIGWDNAADGPRTASGVHVGSTRAEAEAAEGFSVPETTLDMVEISVDGVGGFMSSGGADGTVSEMFAGDTCMAR